jgi:hypothetical protein
LLINFRRNYERLCDNAINLFARYGKRFIC